MGQVPSSGKALMSDSKIFALFQEFHSIGFLPRYKCACKSCLIAENGSKMNKFNHF